VKEFYNAIIEWLRDDDALVTLTGHSDSDLRIYAWSPDADLKIPSLIADFGDSDPMVGRTVYETDVRFESYSTDFNVSDDIVERVRALLVDTTVSGGRFHGPASAQSNADISVKSCEITPIKTPVWNGDMKYWSHEVDATVIWAYL